VVAAFGSLVVAAPVLVPEADAATLYRICHRTNAIKNPYRSIRVAWPALGPSDGARHRGHDGIVFSVSDPEGTHGATPRDEVPGGGNERWGDIFSHTNGTTRAHNWTTEGQEIFNGETFQLSDGVTRTACKSMTIQEYIESEVDAGTSLEGVMADLDDQESSEDLAVKNSLGGSFTEWYAALPPEEKNLSAVTTEVTAAIPTVTTSEAMSVTGSSATLPGTSNPNGVDLTFRYEYSTDPLLAGSSTWDAAMTVAGTPGTTSNASSTVSVSSVLTGLSPATTYYFELVGVNVTGSGDSELSAEIRGGIKNFTTPASTTTTVAATTTTTAAPMTTVLAQITPLECGTLDPRAAALPPTASMEVSLRDTSEGSSRQSGTVALTQPADGPPVELIEVTSSDPTVKVTVLTTGADYNKPSTWEAAGFGQECWKIESFGDGDYRYLLPLTPQSPSGRSPSYYSLVKVKAGSIMSTDPNFQVNTVFPNPVGGSFVFADSNGNGVADSGGRRGDKSISHVIICVMYGPAPERTPTAAPSTPSTTPSSSVIPTTATPTTTPTSDECPTVTTVPTTVPGSPTTTAPGTSGTTVPGSPPTTGAATPTSSVPALTPFSRPIRFRVTVPRSSSAKVVTFNVKVSSGFRQYSMPLRVDVQTFRLKPERLPVSGADGYAGKLLFVLLLLTGAVVLRASRPPRDEKRGR